MINVKLGKLLSFVCVLALGLSAGCSRPKPAYPYVGIDANHMWPLDRNEKEPLRQLQKILRDDKISVVRIAAPWDWPGVGAPPVFAHMDAAFEWWEGIGAPVLIFNVFPAPPRRGRQSWSEPWINDFDVTVARWRAFATEAARRYPEARWLIGNEPNRISGPGGRPELWAAIYTAFYDAVHKVDPDIVVMGPALGHSTPSVEAEDWLMEFFQSGGKVDVVAVHPYDRGLRTMWMVKRVINKLSLDITEVAAVETSGAPDETPAEHVAYLQWCGYSLVVYHVMGGWPPDRMPVGIDHLILFWRSGFNIIPTSDAIKLGVLGRYMFHMSDKQSSSNNVGIPATPSIPLYGNEHRQLRTKYVKELINENSRIISESVIASSRRQKRKQVVHRRSSYVRQTTGAGCGQRWRYIKRNLPNCRRNVVIGRRIIKNCTSGVR